MGWFDRFVSFVKSAGNAALGVAKGVVDIAVGTAKAVAGGVGALGGALVGAAQHATGHTEAAHKTLGKSREMAGFAWGGVKQAGEGVGGVLKSATRPVVEGVAFAGSNVLNRGEKGTVKSNFGSFGNWEKLSEKLKTTEKTEKEYVVKEIYEVVEKRSWKAFGIYENISSEQRVVGKTKYKFDQDEYDKDLKAERKTQITAKERVTKLESELTFLRKSLKATEEEVGNAELVAKEQEAKKTELEAEVAKQEAENTDLTQQVEEEKVKANELETRREAIGVMSEKAAEAMVALEQKKASLVQTKGQQEQQVKALKAEAAELVKQKEEIKKQAEALEKANLAYVKGLSEKERAEILVKLADEKDLVSEAIVANIRKLGFDIEYMAEQAAQKANLNLVKEALEAGAKVEDVFLSGIGSEEVSKSVLEYAPGLLEESLFGMSAFELAMASGNMELANAIASKQGMKKLWVSLIESEADIKLISYVVQHFASTTQEYKELETIALNFHREDCLNILKDIGAVKHHHEQFQHSSDLETLLMEATGEVQENHFATHF